MLKPWMLSTTRLYLLTYAEKKEREQIELDMLQEQLKNEQEQARQGSLVGKTTDS